MRKKLVFLTAALLVTAFAASAPRNASADGCIVYLAEIEGGGTAICVSCPDWPSASCYGR